MPRRQKMEVHGRRRIAGLQHDQKSTQNRSPSKPTLTISGVTIGATNKMMTSGSSMKAGDENDGHHGDQQGVFADATGEQEVLHVLHGNALEKLNAAGAEIIRVDRCYIDEVANATRAWMTSTSRPMVDGSRKVVEHPACIHDNSEAV